MAKVYILKNQYNEYVVNRICNNTSAEVVEAEELTDTVLLDIAKSCVGEYFYVIKTYKEIIFTEFDFSFRPESKDKDYVHIWNNDIALRLFNTENVLSDPGRYSDKELAAGTVRLKSIPVAAFEYPLFDIIFLSYDEEYADRNFQTLQDRFPRAKRLHNIKGIYEAHKAAAEYASYNKSDMFFVVDADAVILPTFDFTYQPESLDRLSVHVWHSKNPVNDLEYGYGGIKLFPTDLLLKYTGSPVDFTTSVSKSFKVIPEVSNITQFNTDPFSAWRSAFRECVKLSSKLIHNQDNTETEQRLHAWCTLGEDREFGDFAVMGANEGRAFGVAHKDQPDMLGLINDFSWLEKKFNS